ncbi:MAG: InlB B-repeat-containing protein [Eubacterium sp.]|jgi:uncharacterized repeat protein (TIGR02543 family)|nr:InlB B-repeat-containing protein [Eubacterium sp.]
MKRENAWRKGASRLLLLILAAAVIVSFSFTSVLAMDERGNDNQNGGSSSNQSGSYPVYIYAKLKTSDGTVVWSAKTSDGQIQESKNKDGWITLGKLTASNSGWAIAPGQSYTTTDDGATGGYTGDFSSLVYKLTHGNSVRPYNVNTSQTLINAADTSGWKLITANGATDYSDEAPGGSYAWHLNGSIGVWKVTYDVNGGSGSVTDNTGYLNNAEASIQSADGVRKAGYTLTGWEDQDGHTYGLNDTITMKKDIKLTAQWTKKSDVAVTYDGNGGKTSDGNETVSDSVTPEISFSVKDNPFSREGYSFTGWNTEKDGSGTAYEAGKKTSVTEATTLYAQWTKNNSSDNNTDDNSGNNSGNSGGSSDNTPVSPSTPVEEHTVTFHYNDDKTADVTQSVPDGGQAVTPDTPSRDGYAFDGWYTDSDLTTKYDFTKSVTGDLSLYAKWTKSNTAVKPVSTSGKVTGILLPKVIATGKHSQTLTWTALKNVDGYFIYTNHCDEGKKLHPFKKTATYKASRARVYKVKNLKTGHNYKYYVAAYKIKNGKKVVVRNSVTVHSVAGNTSARSTNVKSVKAKKHSISLKKGKSYTLKASVSKVNKKKAFLDETHCGLLRYLSADSKIASVDYNTGKIKAKKAGKTTVYVLGVNGIRDKAVVTVK